MKIFESNTSNKLELEVQCGWARGRPPKGCELLLFYVIEVYQHYRNSCYIKLLMLLQIYDSKRFPQKPQT